MNRVFERADEPQAHNLDYSSHLQMEGRSTSFLAKQRCAVVTGANKGIGLEVCRSLASTGVKVVLTSRNKKRGLDAVEKLRASGTLSVNILFHQLDVTDPASVASLADFIRNEFGKLDILVNNAGIFGIILNPDAFSKAVERVGDFPLETQANWSEIATQSYEMAEECLKTNYYGVKHVTEGLIPLLQLSDSARIVNVSSSLGLLRMLLNEWAKGVLSNAENLTEEKVDQVVSQFLEDYREDGLRTKGWPTFVSAYIISKAALNAYTRVLANKYTNLSVTCVHPGFVRTDITCNTGLTTAKDGAEHIVRVALLPSHDHSGAFFHMGDVIGF